MIALLPHCGFLSETSRMLAIGQALAARGEAVVFASHGGPFAGLIRAAGFPLQLLPPEMDGARCTRFVQDVVQIGRPGVRLLSADEVRTAVQAERDFFVRHGVRLTVTGFTLTAMLSTRLAGIPLAASHGGSWVPPVFERGLAPAPTQMPMPGAEWLPDWLKRRILNAGPERMREPAAFLNGVAAELGLPPVPSLAALMLGDLTLVTELPEVLGIPAAELAAWQPRRPAAYRAGTRLVATGPLFARLELPVPPAVEACLDGAAPTALVALTSATPDLVRQSTRAVRAAGYRVVVADTVHALDGFADPGVVVAGVLPNHRVMPRVDLAVTMGGQGSVQTAMASGTPLIAIPLHPEQEFNAHLAVRQGMAIAVAPRHAGGERLTAAARRIQGDRRFAEAARRVAGLYAGVDGAARAAEALLAWRGQQATERPARAA